MSARLQAACAKIEGPLDLVEYRGRMAGHLDGALLLIEAIAGDARANLERNPDDDRTRQVLDRLTAAAEQLEPLVAVLCPRTGRTEAANG